MPLDLTKLTRTELQALIASAKQRLAEDTASSAQAMRDRLTSIAKEDGYDLAELFGQRKAKGPKSGPSISGGKSTGAVKFRHPNDATLTWGGLGKRPRWVHDWLAGGGSLEAARVG